jgi:hypothetical protein
LKLNPNTYRKALDAVRPRFYEHYGDPHKRCSELSAATDVPVLAVVLYAMRDDVLGPLEDLKQAVVALTKFYGYTEVTEWEGNTT